MAQAGYRIQIERPTDAQIGNRDRGSRVFTAASSSALILATPIVLIGLLGSFMGSTTAGAIVGFVVGGIALSFIVPKRMLVINPEWAVYVTQDIFDKGAMVSYGPGVHAAHWWEQRNASGNYSLKVNTEPFSIGVTTASGRVIFDGEYEYAIDLPLLDRAIGVSQPLVEKGITAFIENFLTVQSADKNSQEVRSKEALEEIGRKLSEALMDPNGALAEIQKKYGYQTVAIIINKVTLPEDVQKTRNAIDEAAALFEVVAKLHGMTTTELTAATRPGGSLTPADYQKMLVRAMAVSDNKTSISVNVIEGLEGGGNSAAKAAALINSLGGNK